MMNKRLYTLAITAAIAIGTMSTSLLAQPGHKQRPRAAAAGLAAQIPTEVLESICSLTPQQKEKVQAIHTKLTEELRSLRPARGASADSGAAEKRRTLVRQANADLANVLTQEQKDALRKAAPVLLELRALNIPVKAYPELKLTADQEKRIHAIVQGVREKVKALPESERRAKARELMSAARTEVEAVMTPSQKAVLDQHPTAKRHGNANALRKKSP